MAGLSKRLVQIVVVDDNPADVFLIEEALRSQDIEFQITRFEDGELALNALSREGIARGDFPFPDLILLDLNIPRAEGIEVLKAIRQNAQFASVPVAVLSSSVSPKDREAAETAGADRFVVKATDLQTFLDTVGASVKELLG
jgi:CheY-like chemotaxis protein